MMPRYHTKQNENYYTLNRNLSKILNLFTCSEVPFLHPPMHFVCPFSSPQLQCFSLLHALQLPPLPTNYHFHFHNPSSPPLIYHCQSDSITNPPLNYNAIVTAIPPSLLINYHYHFFDGYQQ